MRQTKCSLSAFACAIWSLAAFAAAQPAAVAVDPSKPQKIYFNKYWDLQYYAPKPGTESVELPFQDGKEFWGQFKFWHTEWWVKTLTYGGGDRGYAFSPPARMDRSLSDYRCAWLRKKQMVDASLKGRVLKFNLSSLVGCDCLVYVNRKPAGAVYRPEGDVDVTDLVTYGQENEFLVFVSSNGLGIPPPPGPDGQPVKSFAYDPKYRGDFMLTKDPPALISYPDTYIDDVFANTSWRQKKLIVETEIVTTAPRTVRLEVNVLDADGRTVKTASQAVTLGKGVTSVKPEIPWADPVTWEFGRGYLYTLKATLVDRGQRYEYPPFRFGFRELWRDGREIMMNGHKQRFRTVYNYGANTFGADFLHSIGYNVIHLSHRVEADPVLDADFLYHLAEQGMGAVAPTAAIPFNRQDAVWKQAAAAAEYERCLARNLRRYRNIPSVLLCYTGVNNIVPRWSMSPRYIGNGGMDGWRTELADRNAALGHKYNPNILFFSHADGNCADVASHNLYLNFTPLQEREQWLEHWSKHGKNPYQAAEFGSPYFQSWYTPGAFSVTEYCAIYFGEEAYREEPRDVVWRTRPGLYIRRVQFPIYWKFIREVVWRTNRSWRTFGLNGGLVWFNLEEGYGMPGWHYLTKLWNQYGVNYSTFKEPVKGRPDWAWPSYDIYQLGNQDFLGYIGGAPLHTDKTHAYYSGETIEKQAVSLWDNIIPTAFSATWWATLADGRQLGGGTFRHTLNIAETVFDKISFTAPEVKEKTSGTIDLVYHDAAGAEVFRDTFAFEVHPAFRPPAATAPEIALVDPQGLSEDVLKGLGLRYRKVASPAGAGNAQFVVFGKNALTGPADLDEAKIAAGLRVLVLPQSGKIWQSLGFETEDRMSRRLFLRDTVSPHLAALTDDILHDWRGAPDYPPTNSVCCCGTFGGAMSHKSDRGPRGWRDMTIAGFVLVAPMPSATSRSSRANST